jgi:hypothetical protein
MTPDCAEETTVIVTVFPPALSTGRGTMNGCLEQMFVAHPFIVLISRHATAVWLAEVAFAPGVVRASLKFPARLAATTKPMTYPALFSIIASSSLHSVQSASSF